MPVTCSVCSKNCHTHTLLECTSFGNWVHNGNRLPFSGLTDQSLMSTKPCDHCISKRMSRGRNDIFIRSPFPIEHEYNVFAKPNPVPKPDITSMTPNQLKTFAEQCTPIKNQLQNHEDSNDEAFYLW